jgi:hypothetical protein
MVSVPVPGSKSVAPAAFRRIVEADAPPLAGKETV